MPEAAHSAWFDELSATLLAPKFDAPSPGQAIYRNNYRGGLVSALGDTYSRLRELVGDDCFQGLAHRYTGHHPSTDANLNHYGADFDGFLQELVDTHPGYGAYPYLPELARLEHALEQVYYAPDPAPLRAPAQHESEAYQSVLLAPLGEQVLLENLYPTRLLLEQDIETDARFEPLVETERLLVWRPQWQSQVETLSAAEFALLRAIGSGVALDALIELGIDPDLQHCQRGLAEGWLRLGIKDAPT